MHLCIWDMKIPFWASSCVSMCKPATLDETEWLLICRIMQQPNLIQLTCSRWRWFFVFYHGDHVMTSISLGILPSHRTTIKKYEGSKPIASCWVQEEADANRSFVEAGSQSSLLEDAELVHVCIYRFSGFCKCTGKYNAQKKPCTKFFFTEVFALSGLTCSWDRDALQCFHIFTSLFWEHVLKMVETGDLSFCFLIYVVRNTCVWWKPFPTIQQKYEVWGIESNCRWILGVWIRCFHPGFLRWNKK